MSRDPSALPLEYGPVEREYGRFRIRRRLPPIQIRPLDPSPRSDIFVVIPEGERQQARGSLQEVVVTDIAVEDLDLPYILCYLTRWMEREQSVIIHDEQQLVQWEKSTADRVLRPYDDEVAVCDVDALQQEKARVEWLIRRRAEVTSALQDLVSAHPEIDISALLQSHLCERRILGRLLDRVSPPDPSQ